MTRDARHRLALPGGSHDYRSPSAGDVCVLLVGSSPISRRTQMEIDGLRRRYGGSVVEPLHITCDRFGADGDIGALTAALAHAAAAVTPLPVRGISLMRIDRHHGDLALKFVVDETEELTRIREAVHDAGRRAGMRSAYGQDTAWTVTVLEDISDDTIESLRTPVELYVADRFLLSRFVNPRVFESIDTIALGTSQRARR